MVPWGRPLAMAPLLWAVVSSLGLLYFYARSSVLDAQLQSRQAYCAESQVAAVASLVSLLREQQQQQQSNQNQQQQQPQQQQQKTIASSTSGGGGGGAMSRPSPPRPLPKAFPLTTAAATGGGPPSVADAGLLVGHQRRPQLLDASFRDLDGGRDLFRAILQAAHTALTTHTAHSSRDRPPLIVEIGAGNGYQAVDAAEHGFRVVSIEAFRRNLKLGQDWARVRKVPADRIRWVHAAASDYNGTAEFWGYEGMGRLLDSKDPRLRTHPKAWNVTVKDSQRFAVPVRRVDEVLAAEGNGAGGVTPFMVKVDVEGNELKVLRGAGRTLGRRPPVLIVEFNPAMMQWSQGDNAHDLLLYLHNLGYRLYDTKVSEPGKRGFLKKYGALRPTEYAEYVQWLLRSREFDHWGSWTDIVAVQPAGATEGWNGLNLQVNGRHLRLG